MAQLNAMQQRIRAIETIRKITHAMRLISMSTHSRLRHKKETLEQYKAAFHKLRAVVSQAVRQEKIVQETSETPEHLIILVGSQKGLSGTFNINLFKYFESEIATNSNYLSFITVGKHATDYVKALKKIALKEFNIFNATNFFVIAQEIASYIQNKSSKYNKIIVYSNYPRTFFNQKPQHVQLLPFVESESTIPTENRQDTKEYIWEDSPEHLYAAIKQLTITITIQELLFESLLAEQAARFLSMDAATRNAENLLTHMKLEYNKLRQAAITRELTELASSL